MFRRELEEYLSAEDRLKTLIKKIDSKLSGGMLLDNSDYVDLAWIFNQLMEGKIILHRISELVKEARHE